MRLMLFISLNPSAVWLRFGSLRLRRLRPLRLRRFCPLRLRRLLSRALLSLIAISAVPLIIASSPALALSQVALAPCAFALILDRCSCVSMFVPVWLRRLVPLGLWFVSFRLQVRRL